MEINKKELKKISSRFRNLASYVMNAHYNEQLDLLEEFVNYVEQTSLIYDYIQSLSYDINGLEELLDTINVSYGRQALDLGSDSNKRTYLLYKTFEYIVSKKMMTYNFGWYYSGGKKYQDMAKAFGDRMVYPFVSEIEEYIKEISIDMGFDNDSKYNININSTGVQVNIAEHGGTVHAEQENSLNSEELKNAIVSVSNIIEKIDNLELKSTLEQSLDTIKNEIEEKQPKKKRLTSALTSMKFIASTVAMLPDLTSGIQMIASILEIAI